MKKIIILIVLVLCLASCDAKSGNKISDNLDYEVFEEVPDIPKEKLGKEK